MYRGSLQNLFHAKSAHRVPKILTLAVSSCVLLAMVSIDASASAFGGRDSNAVRTDVVLTLASESGNSQFSGLVKRWVTVTAAIPSASPTTTSTGGSTGAGSTGGGTVGGGTGGGATTSPPTTTTSPPTTTTTPPPTTTTTTAPPASTPAASGGLITAGPSRNECLVADVVASSLASIDSVVSNFENATGTTVTCFGSYLNSAVQWSDWADPWIVGPSGAAFTQWVAQSPQTRQMVLDIDLIPASLENINNPLGWEQSCAAGNFNSYATELATNLVNAGLQNTVIRLGAEMNGPWEVDFMGTTTQEQNLWATCFANEVTSMRQASGEHFLFDWNPNSCYENVPFANYYPGNAYVDILGLDFYDQSCDTPTTALTFSQLASVPGGLDDFEAFAAAQGKPMSFPEWGLVSPPSGDDPGYVNGVGSAVENGNFSFQEYFDIVDQGTMILGSGTPLSLAAYQKWFATS